VPGEDATGDLERVGAEPGDPQAPGERGDDLDEPT
jgi:hypothetical protein